MSNDSELRLPPCYIIGGPHDGEKIVDVGGEMEYKRVRQGEKFNHFYEYDAVTSTQEHIKYNYILPNVIAAIVHHGKQTS